MRSKSGALHFFDLDLINSIFEIFSDYSEIVGAHQALNDS